MEEVDWELKFHQMEQRFEILQKNYQELKVMKEDLYSKQLELLKEHKLLLEKYYKS